MFDFNDRTDPGYRLLHGANIPSRFKGLEFSDLKPYSGSVTDTAHKWISDVVDGKIVAADGSPLSGKGLLFIGSPGHGKTTLATVIAQTLCREVDSSSFPDSTRQGRQVYFTSYPDLLEMAKRQFGDQANEAEERVLAGLWGHLSQPLSTKVLILDDLGREHRTASGWAENYFDNLLRRRYDLGLPTVVTSNVPRGDWAGVYGERMDSFAKEAFVTRAIISPEGDRR